jgi:hypothetical protein
MIEAARFQFKEKRYFFSHKVNFKVNCTADDDEPSYNDVSPNLLAKLVKFSLFPREHLRHLSESHLELIFNAFAGAHFLHQSLLVRGCLPLHRVKVLFEVGEQFCELLFLCG